MNVKTRFAPSPTGFLHIGGARTALFNWLFAKHHEGKFFLRIEDTDRKRSTPDAVNAILEGLKWLELDWDGEVIFQSKQLKRHREAAYQLLDKGLAYKCFCSPEELINMRENARSKGLQPKYDGTWRDKDPSEAPDKILPTIRFKAPKFGSTQIEDQVQGAVKVKNQELDDMVILRSDGTPTYMLSVVVDDHDMGISHVIRGDDHLSNTFRQIQLYKALEWKIPNFAHVPLIHGSDGAKMSKRHGSLEVAAYSEMGFIPKAIRNYLLRLGWSHGDDEIIDMEQAIEWFNFSGIGRGPSRFDFKKLESLNAHYLRNLTNDVVVTMAEPKLSAQIGRELTHNERMRLSDAIPSLKPRAKTMNQLVENSLFYFSKRPISISNKALHFIKEDGGIHLSELLIRLGDVSEWDQQTLESVIRVYGDSHSVKLGVIAQPLRAALTGSTVSPSIFEVMVTLGREETLARLRDAHMALHAP